MHCYIVTQDSLPAAGSTLPGGIDTHRIRTEGFCDVSDINFPLPQALPGAAGLTPWGLDTSSITAGDHFTV
jgi:hypothetical protein